MAPGLRAVRSVAGLSGVDTGTGRHYRDMILAGRRGLTSLDTLRAEVSLLEREGWQRTPSAVVLKDGHVRYRMVGLARHDVVISLNGPRGIYVALQYLTGVRNLDHASLGPAERRLAPLNRAIRSGTPMLGAVMGHQDN